MSMNEKLALRPAEAADLLGVSRSRVYTLIKANELPHVKIGGACRVPMEALRAWLQRQALSAPALRGRGIGRR